MYPWNSPRTSVPPRWTFGTMWFQTQISSVMCPPLHPDVILIRVYFCLLHVHLFYIFMLINISRHWIMNSNCIHGIILLLLGSEGLSSKLKKIVRNIFCSKIGSITCFYRLSCCHRSKKNFVSCEKNWGGGLPLPDAMCAPSPDSDGRLCRLPKFRFRQIGWREVNLQFSWIWTVTIELEDLGKSPRGRR